MSGIKEGQPGRAMGLLQTLEVPSWRYWGICLPGSPRGHRFNLLLGLDGDSGDGR